MDYEKYFNLINIGNSQEALEYKNAEIPDVVYKYYSLTDDEKMNEQKLRTLENGKVYLSSLAGFNDPFEGNSLIFDNEKLAKAGWSVDFLEKFVSELKTHVRICCFSNAKEKQQNMPMWAYYANNHKGYCVEYKLDSKLKKQMYPVSYDEKRSSGNVLITSLLNELVKISQQHEDINENTDEYLTMLSYMSYLTFTCKHISWRHEREIRLLLPDVCGDYVDMQPEKIYVGMQCEDRYMKELLRISKKFEKNCKDYKMDGIGNDFNHFLLERELK